MPGATTIALTPLHCTLGVGCEGLATRLLAQGATTAD